MEIDSIVRKIEFKLVGRKRKYKGSIKVLDLFRVRQPPPPPDYWVYVISNPRNTNFSGKKLNLLLTAVVFF